MNLRSVDLKKAYSSESDDILRDFYIPALQQCKEYNRLAGFFSSKSLAVAARGISGLIKNGGRMRLIVSPKLHREDLEIMMNASKSQEEYIEERILEELERLESKFVRDHVFALGWMIANGRLEVKVAVAYNNRGELLTFERIQREGLFHQKVGILRDSIGNTITFSGSVNETAVGWLGNIEEFKVFRNWEAAERDYVESDIKKFKNFWENHCKNVEVMTIPEGVRKKLIEIAPESIDELDMMHDWNDRFPCIPIGIKLRKYQKLAIDAWFEKTGKGIFEMATGSGKTITALALVSQLSEKLGGNLAIVIACPYKHLVIQWKNAAEDFNLKPIIAFESHEKWEKYLNSKIASFNGNVICGFSLITTHKTFGMQLMQKSLSKLNGRHVVLIIDEVHHFGAKHLRDCLPRNVRYRLGLSATPEDWYDNSRNEYIGEYFEDGIVYRYGLKDAINQGWLTRYHYFPHIVELTEEESDVYYEISKKIARKLAQKANQEDFEVLDDPYLKKLRFERARLIGSAENKLEALRELLEDKTDSRFNLVYCGDGIIEDTKQVDRVVEILGRELKMRVHPFTAHEGSRMRRRLLERFEKGELQCLVAIRCLDEGVDVPATQNAYILASSSNPRQYIQRRGRILRKHSGKTFSYIHDFVVVPPTIGQLDVLDPLHFNLERSMIMKEMKRVSWFADIAENGPQARKSLLEVRKKYGLLHL